jgi:hypothetical protein
MLKTNTEIDMWLKPLLSLFAGWQTKLPIALSLGFVWDLIIQASLHYGKADPNLAGGAVILFVLDWVLGIRAALKRGDKFTSAGLRQACNKAIGYVGFALAAIVISNTLQSTVFNLLTQHFGNFAIIYIILTEGFSCLENALGKEDALKALKRIIKLQSGKIDDLTDLK